MNVSRIGNTLNTYVIKKPLNYLASLKPAQNIYKGFQNNDLSLIGKVAITSILLKDGLGCYLYVKQSLNNEKIPSDKRKFVAALDLTNGGLMMATQLLTYKFMESKKVQNWIFNRSFGKSFERSMRKCFVAAMGKVEKYKDLSAKEMTEIFNKHKDKTKGCLKMITSIVGAVIIAKRIIVPFIATPLADKAKIWMSRNDKPDCLHEGTENTFEKNKVGANLLAKFKGHKCK